MFNSHFFFFYCGKHFLFFACFFFWILLLFFSRSVISHSATPWTAAHQASLSFTTPWSLLKLLPLNQWCCPMVSSSVVPFSLLQSFPESLDYWPAAYSFVLCIKVICLLSVTYAANVFVQVGFYLTLWEFIFAMQNFRNLCVIKFIQIYESSYFCLLGSAILYFLF